VNTRRFRMTMVSRRHVTPAAGFATARSTAVAALSVSVGLTFGCEALVSLFPASGAPDSSAVAVQDIGDATSEVPAPTPLDSSPVAAEDMGDVASEVPAPTPPDSSAVAAEDSGDATSELAAASAEYLGCFTDSSAMRDLPYAGYDGQNNTVEGCIAACAAKGYLYAGAQYFTQCFCGDSYGGQGTSTQCTTRCGGNPSEICGGTFCNSVYRTGVVLRDGGAD
jgi:hypothetical protein